MNTFSIFLFWSFHGQNHLLYPCPNLMVQDFMKEKNKTLQWCLNSSNQMKVSAGKMMHACSGLLWQSGTCFLSSKMYFLHVLYLITYSIHTYRSFPCIVPPYTDLVNIKSSNWTRPMGSFLTCPCTCMSTGTCGSSGSRPWHHALSLAPRRYPGTCHQPISFSSLAPFEVKLVEIK